MDAEFWADAVRDLGLVAAGGLLTLLGVWLTNRAAAKREHAAELMRQKNAAAERNRAAVEKVRELVFTLYVELRTWEEQGREGTPRFATATFQEAQLGRALIADAEVRRLLEVAFSIARNADTLERQVSGPYTAGSVRTNAMYYATLILSAHLRGDDFEKKHLTFLSIMDKATKQAVNNEVVARLNAEMDADDKSP